MGWRFGAGGLVLGVLAACSGGASDDDQPGDQPDDCSVTAGAIAASATAIRTGETARLTATVHDMGRVAAR
jgi:hypothetical protein